MGREADRLFPARSDCFDQAGLAFAEGKTDTSSLPGFTAKRNRPSSPSTKAPWLPSPPLVPVPPVGKASGASGEPLDRRAKRRSAFPAVALERV